MCHVFRFGSSEAYNLVVSADGVLVCCGVRLGNRAPPPEKQGVTYLEKVQMLGWGLS